jgi:hypothetical protein
LLGVILESGTRTRGAIDADGLLQRVNFDVAGRAIGQVAFDLGDQLRGHGLVEQISEEVF